MLRERINMLREVEPYIGNFYSKDWIRKNILMFTEDDIKSMNDQMEDEKKSGEIEQPEEDF